MKSKSGITKLLMLLIAAICTILTADAQYYHLASGGKLITFESFDAAIEQANPRDTIYLTNPMQISINITKPIVIIGNSKCAVRPSIDLNDSNQETAKVNIEGVILYQKAYIKSNLGTLEFKNCNYDNSGYSMFITKLESKIENVIIDRCTSYTINLSYNSNDNDGAGNFNYKCNVGSLSVRNSCIDNTISGKCADKEKLMLINSWISNIQNDFYGDLRNCLYGNSNNSEGEREYSYKFNNGGSYTVNGNNKKVGWGDTEDLVALGFVGEDGTAAGPTGGDEPHWSLLPDVPTVDFQNSNVEYDKATKKVKIKVSVLKD